MFKNFKIIKNFKMPSLKSIRIPSLQSFKIPSFKSIKIPYLALARTAITHFKKQSCNIGLDIGSLNVKLVELEAKGRGWLLRNASSLALTPGVSVSAQLKTFVESQNISGRQVNISVSGQAVIMRYIFMPQMTLSELKSTMQFEAREHIPFPLDEMILDCAIIRERIENNNMLIALAAVRKAIVQERINLLQNVGLIPKLIDIDCFCLANAFNNSHLLVGNTAESSKAKTIGLLNIGARLTNMAILEEKDLRFSRDIAFGTHEATLSNLVNEISSSIDYYENQNGKPVEKIYLSGGAAQSSDVVNLLRHQIAIPLDIFGVFSNVRLKDNVHLEEAGIKESMFAIAFGLALR